MKITIDKNKINFNPENFMRKAGYGFIIDKRAEKESFVRHFGSQRYPRFHCYIKKQGDDIIFDLHLDQKKASYAGASMHNAEYDGEVVEAEIKRLRQFMIAMQNNRI